MADAAALLNKRLEALRRNQEAIRALSSQYHRERLALLQEHEKLCCERFFTQRRRLVSGLHPEHPDGVPEFWLKVFQHSDVVKHCIDNRFDERIMRLVKDVSVEVFTAAEGDELVPSDDDDSTKDGFRLHFHFDPAKNQFFDNAVLTKECYWDRSERQWEEGGMATKDGKVKSMKTVSDPIRWKGNPPGMSFFVKFFKQTIGEGEGDAGGGLDEDDEGLFTFQEVAYCIAMDLVPRATYFYTGIPVERQAKTLHYQYGNLS